MSVPSTYTGATMLDEQGTKIGDIRDVIYEQDAHIGQTPKWFVVKTGLLWGQHYVPSAGSYWTDQDVVVPYRPEQVKGAPKAGGEHVLSEQDEDELGRYYRLTDQN